MKFRDKFHWMRVQKNDLTGKDSTGALNRSTGWRTFKENIRCQVQQLDKGDLELKYDIKADTDIYIIFFDDTSFSPSPSFRFIINNIPTLQVPFIPEMDEIKILEFIGFNANYIGRIPRKNTLEIYVKDNKRWQL